MGHEVHLATTDVKAGRAIPGVVVHDMNVKGAIPGPVRFVRRWKKVQDILRVVSPDIVHGHCVSWSGGYAAYLRRHPLVLTPWGSDILLGPTRSCRRWLATRWRLRQGDLVTVDSEDLKRAVVALGVSKDRVTLIQWGVNVERIQAMQGSGRLRQLAGVPLDAPVVLSTRRFEPVYNLETVIRAIPNVLLRMKRDVYFVFIGGGSLHAQFESLARNCGVEKYVRFIGDVAHEELEECYGGADVYVSVPQSDTTSVSLLEAMAAALPAVVSDVPSNLEWIKDRWNGLVVPYGDAEALVNALLRLLDDRIARREFGARNEKIVAEKADHIANMRKMEGLYWKLANEGSRC